MAIWEEVEQAHQEKRHELLLSGAEFNKKLEINGGELDTAIFNLTNLNFLRLSSSSLIKIPSDIGNLVNLTNLTLQNNKIVTLPSSLGKLKKLKFLDVSENCLEVLPEEINELTNLATLNARSNSLSSLPLFYKRSSLAHLDLRNNKLQEFASICCESLALLADVFLASNEIHEIPLSISMLKSLKTLDLSQNNLKIIPGEVIDCTKLKEINAKGNPLSDRRLRKLVEADRSLPRQVLDYIKQHGQRTKKEDQTSNKDKKKKGGKKENLNTVDSLCDKLEILSTKEPFTIQFKSDVREIRPYIVCCILRNLDLTGTRLKKFITLQTKLHDGICEKRVAATIATHDLSKIIVPLCYTAKSPQEIFIHPLNRKELISADSFFKDLQHEAEAIRKQMKRNAYSGIHKYLYLVEGWKKWPCLLDAQDTVISFPPITNSDITKISESTTDVLLEVTSSASLPKAKEVMEALIFATLEAELSTLKTEMGKRCLSLEQVRTLDDEGSLKVVFPSRTDLVISDKRIDVVRD